VLQALASQLCTRSSGDARAAKGVKEATIIRLTPAVCAMIFLDHNPHNRDWKPAKTIEYGRIMSEEDGCQRLKMFCTIIGTLADEYANNPTGDCRPPVTPKIDQQGFR
jgi:hypothetical protein